MILKLNFDLFIFITFFKRLKPEDLKDNQQIKLKFVKFQNVQNITVCTNTF